jgi:hypothetical protein
MPSTPDGNIYPEVKASTVAFLESERTREAFRRHREMLGIRA